MLCNGMQGINIAPPEGSLPWPWLQASHWLHPANASGIFSQQGQQRLVSEMHHRFGPSCKARLFDAKQGASSGQNQQDPQHLRLQRPVQVQQ